MFESIRKFRLDRMGSAIVILSLAFLVIALFVLNNVHTRYKARLDSDKQQYMSDTAKLLAASLKLPVILGEQLVAESLINQMIGRNGIDYVAIIDSTGKTIAETHIKTSGRDYIISTAIPKSAERSEKGKHDPQVVIKYNNKAEDAESKRFFIHLLFFAGFLALIMLPIPGLIIARGRSTIKTVVRSLSSLIPDEKDLTPEIMGLIYSQLGAKRSDLLTEILEEKKLRAIMAAEEAARHYGAYISKQNLAQFFAKLSHDLRTPISHIHMLSSVSKKSVESGKLSKSQITEIFERLDIQVSAINEMFDDIIDLSKIGQGVVDETESVINLIDVIDSEIERNADVSRSRERLFSGRISQSVPIKGITNEQVLRKAIRNLLTNAIRYTPKGGKILLAARWRDDRLTIDVMDQGCGISRNFVSHMFEPFERESSNRKDSGSGLGLYIVKSSLTSLGGDVHLMRSEINKGSWFRMELPIREPSWPVADEASNGMNLWILHDDPKTCRIVHDRISHCRFDKIKQFSKFQDVIPLIRHISQPTILLIGGSLSIAQSVQQDALMKPPIYPVMMDSHSRADMMTMENKMWAGHWTDVSIRRMESLVRQIGDQIEKITQPQILRKIRTLLVDDEPLNLEYLPGYLANGVSLDQSMIATAESGAVALQLLEANLFDLVIVDYQMPEMNGLELAECIRAKWPQVVVAGISANVTEQVKQQFYDLGVDVFIGRPPKEYQLAALTAKFNEHKEQTAPPAKRMPDKTVLEEKLRIRLLRAKSDITDAMRNRDVVRVRSLTHAIDGACNMMGREDLASLFVEARNMAIHEEWHKAEEMINDIG